MQTENINRKTGRKGSKLRMREVALKREGSRILRKGREKGRNGVKVVDKNIYGMESCAVLIHSCFQSVGKCQPRVSCCVLHASKPNDGNSTRALGGHVYYKTQCTCVIIGISKNVSSLITDPLTQCDRHSYVDVKLIFRRVVKISTSGCQFRHYDLYTVSAAAAAIDGDHDDDSFLRLKAINKTLCPLRVDRTHFLRWIQCQTPNKFMSERHMLQRHNL